MTFFKKFSRQSIMRTCISEVKWEVIPFILLHLIVVIEYLIIYLRQVGHFDQLQLKHVHIQFQLNRSTETRNLC